MKMDEYKAWKRSPEGRKQMSEQAKLQNGMTLCAKPCHKDIHKEIRMCTELLKQFRSFQK